jgi:hypothetical protein
MKNKWVLVLSAFLVFGLGVIGCDTGNGTSSGGNTDPKTIVIEGIQNEYTAQGSIRVFNDLNDVVNNQPVNAGIGYGTISGGKLTVELTVPQNNTGSSQTKWTGNGSYYIYFIPQVNNNYSTTTGRIYFGDGQSPQKYNINEAVITIPYSAFQQYSHLSKQ